jgi:cold shock CspA family protein
MTGERRQGRVKWFSKQYGFIKDLNDNADYFVHFTAIRVPETVYGKLHPNEYVEFVVKNDVNGKKYAMDITGIKEGPLLCEATTYMSTTDGGVKKIENVEE